MESTWDIVKPVINAVSQLTAPPPMNVDQDRNCRTSSQSQYGAAPLSYTTPDGLAMLKQSDAIPRPSLEPNILKKNPILIDSDPSHEI